MERKVLHGRAVSGGCVEGEALVTRECISGWGGITPVTGTVTEVGHELEGQSFAGKILVFPGAKGSSGWSVHFHYCRLLGTAPKAVLYNITTAKIALGAVVMHVPAMTDFDCDPIEEIRTGDWVRVDADHGTVEILRRKEETVQNR